MCEASLTRLMRMSGAWLLIAATLLGAGTCRTAHAATPFGDAVFAILEDPDPSVRAYGWTAMDVLGQVSQANPLREGRFRTFVAEDRARIEVQVTALLDRTRADAKLAADGAGPSRSGYEDVAEFLRVAKILPELAAIVASRPSVEDRLTAKDLAEIRQEALRPRPVNVPFEPPDEDVARELATMGGTDEAKSVDAAGALADYRLRPMDADRLGKRLPFRRTSRRGPVPGCGRRGTAQRPKAETGGSQWSPLPRMAA